MLTEFYFYYIILICSITVPLLMETQNISAELYVVFHRFFYDIELLCVKIKYYLFLRLVFDLTFSSK